MAKVTIAATIPVAQYANIQPSFDIEAETHDAAVDIGLKKLKEIWDRTAEKPLTIDRQNPVPENCQVLRCAVSGTELLFDPIAHTYHDRAGVRYTGGSTFASRYKEPFPGGIIAGKIASKHGVDAARVQAMWALNAEASATFGTSVHAALQLYGEYLELSRETKGGSDESALTSNPVLRPIVEAFFADHKDEKAFYEALVANSKERACGLIDRLTVEDDGAIWVEDFKTNTSVEKAEKILPPFSDAVPHTALGAYYLQLSYYARCLMAHGRHVKGLRVHHWTGTEWKLYEHPVVNLDAAFQES